MPVLGLCDRRMCSRVLIVYVLLKFSVDFEFCKFCSYVCIICVTNGRTVWVYLDVCKVDVDCNRIGYRYLGDALVYGMCLIFILYGCVLVFCVCFSKVVFDF